MKLSELIQHVGDEHVQMQTLATSLVTARVGKRDGEITFATDRSKVLQLLDEPEKRDHVCMIVWLPRDRMPESMR